MVIESPVNREIKHAGRDLNPQPADLESAALPIELPACGRHPGIRASRHQVAVTGYLDASCLDAFYFLFILCSVCLRNRGENFLNPALSFSSMPPLVRISVR